MLNSLGLSSSGFALFLCLGAWACSGLLGTDGPDGPRVITDSPSYSNGDTIRVTLENLSERTLEFGWCDVELKRREEGAWIGVPTLPEGVVCAGAVTFLTPGGEYFARQFIFDWIPSGTYRFRVPLSYQSSHDKMIVFSNRFFIEQ